MAIPNSGSFSLNTLQTEFGGSNPISLGEYYRGGTYVRNSSSTSLVPSSGAIKYSNFRGSSKVIVYRIKADTTNANAKDLFNSLDGGTIDYWGGNYDKELIINPGINVGASNRLNNALILPKGMGGTLVVTNNGRISGAGGQRTNLADGAPYFISKNGGTAIYTEVNVTINNITISGQPTAIIRGGGGSGEDGATGGKGGDGGIGYYISSYNYKWVDNNLGYNTNKPRTFFTGTWPLGSYTNTPPTNPPYTWVIWRNNTIINPIGSILYQPYFNINGTQRYTYGTLRTGIMYFSIFPYAYYNLVLQTYQIVSANYTAVAGCSGSAGGAGGLGGRGRGSDYIFSLAGANGSNGGGTNNCTTTGNVGGAGGAGGKGGGGGDGGGYGQPGNASPGGAGNGSAGSSGSVQGGGTGGAGSAGSASVAGSAAGLAGYYVQRANSSITVTLNSPNPTVSLRGLQNF